jgi:Ethanolamine utilization protein EutJ (predicted chaperonin)
MFSTVFLCVKDIKRNKFTCKEFESFLKADKYFNDTYKDTSCQSTMTPVCKFMPAIAKRHVLQYKLANIFNRVSIV